MIQSLRKNKYGILFIITSALLSCGGQLLWKLSTDGNIYYLLGGFFLYGIGALAMIMSYRFGKVSVLQPLLSLNYIISPILGYFVLNEAMSSNKIIGITVIFLGAILIAGGDNND